MDIAVLSDIHGNYIALEHCVNYALSRNIDTFIFLGDYVGELAYPEKTMKLIYEISTRYKCYFIRGNKENYWLNFHENGERGWQHHNSTTGSLLYTYSHLNKKDLDFFRSLQISQNVYIDDMPEITICHGSPDNVNEKLLANNDKTYEIMDSISSSIILCGHTHIQSKIEHNGKAVLNAGAVGVPIYSNGKTQFLILHAMKKTKSWTSEFISLSYNVDKVIEELHESGLDKHAPYWCSVTKNLLRKGDLSHGTVLARAMALCKEETGNCIWPNVSEKYWKQAVEEMIKD
ncbi:MAG TPA: metallophosphoesterase family protein [Lachnospiraceae bacterium]|nr:metallophosphoesterase family protein [Lachnospiraceae bacterium]